MQYNISELAMVNKEEEFRIQNSEFRIIRLRRTDSCLLASEFLLFISIILLLNFFLPCRVGAETPLSLDQIIAKVQDVYDRTEGVQADFDQETRLASWGQTQMAKGKVSFKKNGRMYWEYSAPVPQKIISDGNKVWVYIPQDRQVTIYEMNRGLQSEIAYNLILGKGNLKKEFDITLADSASENKNCYRLKLKPVKPQTAIDHIVLSVDMKSFQVLESEIIDPFGNSNRIRFSQIRTNNHLPDSCFQFVVPEGVDVITSSHIPISR
jgi:outer membrane lipoprotein carrier protein